MSDSEPQDLHKAIAAWFLGPRAENMQAFMTILGDVMQAHANTRLEYYPDDPNFIVDSIQTSDQYRASMAHLRREVEGISAALNKWSIPFFSPRYAGHMCMEMSLPSILGWMVTIMFNPNNVAYEASPYTTRLELYVGKQLCKMLGYPVQLPRDPWTDDPNAKASDPWGHIACDGTVANMESMWAARNLKFYPLSLHAAMSDDGPLAWIADDFTIRTATKPYEDQLFINLDEWDLLNLPPNEVLGISERLNASYGISATYLAKILSPYLVQTSGKDVLMQKYKITQEPQYLAAATRHYSWPKAAALIGIGSENCVPIAVDNNARADLDDLTRILEERLARKQAVYAVVAIIGSTEEGCVDPLDRILKLRDDFAARGLTFIVHADAAWGGYFASMIREPHDVLKMPAGMPPPDFDYVPSVSLRKSTTDQFKALAKADSITIDPHKAGYIPYPAGGLCYRDGRMRFLLTWTAPYLQQSKQGESIGIYGIEGSKPGAPAASCYIHHQVVGLHKEGHGALLGEVSFTCRRFSAHWAAMSDKSTDYIVVPFNPLVHDGDEDKMEQEKRFIRERILGKTNRQIVADREAMDELCALGSDLNINAFTCNFRINGKVNEDVEEANYLNKRIFDRLSVTELEKDPRDVPLFLSSTVFGQEEYGQCARHFQKRLGLETESKQDLYVLRNVVMSPFPTGGDFVDRVIADVFIEVLKEEVQRVVKRNTVVPAVHQFVLQGKNKLYLVYCPQFYHANGRSQLILSGTIDSDAFMQEYRKVRDLHPGNAFTIKTADAVVLEDVLKAGEFNAKVNGPVIWGVEFRVINLQIVKDRSLLSKYRDTTYPVDSTPFYLYGTTTEHHIDHMLLRAPNTQISSGLVTLDVRPPLTADQLSRGVIAKVKRSELAMQPFGAETDPKAIFAPATEFKVVVYHDKHEPIAHGPNLANVDGEKVLAEGTIKLGNSVWVDTDGPNAEDTSDPSKQANKALEHKVLKKWREIYAEL
ncbi:PLP-dependent transferase [Punctularia strigosozonata HHB-11173 SS5]|uniref:PLP-dependent transferase n=1 Tax=Punctularia strigosozonata (strain HHB-11173) TaxID=741275 RepID=UPI000441845C|nr:PLP-dependent transferase [Punctularia strigosozonata HHB-11173 SS5]EIN06879.1 PLP-dependent transferase [Punctularia strigosozonata HHB-11173 SS5]